MGIFSTIVILNAAIVLTFGFTTRPSSIHRPSSKKKVYYVVNNLKGIFDGLTSGVQIPSFNKIESIDRFCKARELVRSLVEEEKCFSAESGARKFGEFCAVDCIYEDCFEKQPFVGKMAVTDHMLAKVNQRKGKGDVRIDRISDGSSACGFSWTWVSTDGNREGLRGTTFVELNEEGSIQYVREIPEPLFKPGDLTVELLKAVTKDAVASPPPTYETKTPKSANEVAKYLFCDVQGGDIDESMRLFSDTIVYRDFNYDEVLRGTDEVRSFIEDFSFPGIEFRPDHFDDGIHSTCFTWDVCLNGSEKSIKGISFYELDQESRLIKYVRDVPESSIKPPPLGYLARLVSPDIGIFKSVPVGSRPGGM